MRWIVSGLVLVWLAASVQSTWMDGSAWARNQDDNDSRATRPPIKRAARPKFTQREISTLFFSDIFAEALVGERPSAFADVASTSAGSTNSVNAPDTPTNPTNANQYAWSHLIAPEALESEIKRLNGIVEGVVTTPRKFESGGYRDARLHFSMLAMLFAIVTEYDQNFRYKENGPIARDLFATMAANAKAGSDDVYRQAKLRRDDLREIVNGGTVSAAGEFDPVTDWATVVDRPPLMERLEISLNERIKPWTSNAREFKANADALQVEAQVVAAIAEVLTRDGLPDADADGYVGFAKEMQNAALDIVKAIKSDDYDSAAMSASLISQSCQNCHADWQ